MEGNNEKMTVDFISKQFRPENNRMIYIRSERIELSTWSSISSKNNPQKWKE